MFGAGAGAAVVLGSVALFALSGSDGSSDGLLLTMSIIAVVVAAFAALSIRFVQTDLVHPLEAVCDAMRELAEGNRDVYVPHAERNDEIGAMARYLVVIKKAAGKFDRMRKEREEAEAEEARRLAEIESEREQQRAKQSETLVELADKFERTIGDIVSGVAAASSQLQATASSMASARSAARRRLRPSSRARRRPRRRKPTRRSRR
jgi:methyl-accepting chemotaxis protein